MLQHFFFPLRLKKAMNANNLRCPSTSIYV